MSGEAGAKVVGDEEMVGGEMNSGAAGLEIGEGEALGVAGEAMGMDGEAMGV